MPEQHYPLRIADEFAEGLAAICSPRVLAQIKNDLETLSMYPEIGSADVRLALSERYGQGLRKIPISSFVIVYRFDGGHVDVLALVYGPSIV